MKVLVIVNDPPCGTERAYNGLRLGARTGQKTSEGYYDIERMLKRVLAGNGRVLLCGTCMHPRGIEEVALVAGPRRSTMDELAAATVAATKFWCFEDRADGHVG